MAARTEQIDQDKEMIVDHSLAMALGFDEIAVSENQGQLFDDVLIVDHASIELPAKTGNFFVQRGRHTTSPYTFR